MQRPFQTILGADVFQCVHGIFSRFPCRYCGRRFTQQSALQVHERTHTGKMPFRSRFFEIFLSLYNKSVHVIGLIEVKRTSIHNNSVYILCLPCCLVLAENLSPLGKQRALWNICKQCSGCLLHNKRKQ